jgi:hypothetical protein
VVAGKTRLQVRDATASDISPAQIESFLATLADTCNVARSARVAGFSASTAYRRRQADASFRAGWAQAVAEAYAKLELVLLERAMNGTIKRIKGKDGESRVREYSNTLAVALLKRHADAAAEVEDDIAEEAEEARERILARLARMRERIDSETGAPQG